MVASVAQVTILLAIGGLLMAVVAIKLFFRRGKDCGDNQRGLRSNTPPPPEGWTRLAPQRLPQAERRAQEKLDEQFPRDASDLPRASQNSWANGAMFVIVIGLIMAWTLRRVLTGQSVVAGETVPFFWVFSAMFAILALQLILAFFERTRFKDISDRHIVGVIVPLYNENTAIAWRTIKSILLQKRRPDYLVVVNDGSDPSFEQDYSHMNWAASLLAKMVGVVFIWKDTKNQGKRHAQAEGFGLLPEWVDKIVTVDSDSSLDRNAIHYGLQRFADPKVMSVAGMILTKNACTNVLTRVMDQTFVVQQATDRASMSRLGSVLVNSGAIALYDASVLRDNIQAYLSEKFLGVHVEFSDDSLLTLFALQQGKAVQDPRVFSFSMMPESTNNHKRQQLRWFRGSFIRSIWRIRYLRIWSPGFLRQLLGWMMGVTTLIVSVSLLVFYPIFENRIVWEYALVPVVVGYILGSRYFSVRRSDMSRGQQFGIFAISPFAWLYQTTVLRYFRIWGMLTCRKTGWQTRQGGAEVTDKEPAKVNA